MLDQKAKYLPPETKGNFGQIYLCQSSTELSNGATEWKKKKKKKGEIREKRI